MRNKIEKLFGDRVALTLTEEETTGLLVAAPNQMRMHVLSDVVAVGEKCEEIKPGDVVFWQNNGLIEANCRYMLNGKPIFVLLSGDMIARLSSKKVTLETFQVLGRWCLCRRETFQPSKTIIVPDSVADTSQEMVVKYFLQQKGSKVELDVNVGDEVIVERNRANHLQIEQQKFVYLLDTSVLGIIK